MYESKEYRATVNNSLNLARIRVLTETEGTFCNFEELSYD